MPRTREQNQKVREETKARIPDAALGLYVRYGYNGTDMDRVAAEAGVAKGLLYYYFKNKNIMFRELFDVMISRISAMSNLFFKNTEGMNPLERLVRYSVDIYGFGESDPRLIKFAMRMPFDAYGIFGEKGWREGIRGSDVHTKNISMIVSDGIKTGEFGCSDASSAANAYWTVFVSGLFNYIKMMGDSGEKEINESILEKLLEFGMNGLSAGDGWKGYLSEIIKEMKDESI